MRVGGFFYFIFLQVLFWARGQGDRGFWALLFYSILFYFMGFFFGTWPQCGALQK
jgi:hypothetical protein